MSSDGLVCVCVCVCVCLLVPSGLSVCLCARMDARCVSINPDIPVQESVITQSSVELFRTGLALDPGPRWALQS